MGARCLKREAEWREQAEATAILESFVGDRPEANVYIESGQTSVWQVVPKSLLEWSSLLHRMRKAIAGACVSGAIKDQARTQYSVHPPSRFVCNHRDKLLPDWGCPARSMLIVLQPCECDLQERSPLTEMQKRKLRRQFLKLGYTIAAQLKHMGYTVALFDPRTGFPLLTRPGDLRLDDVAIVQAALGYQVTNSHGCSIILHPTWGRAVYPSTLVSSAEPALVEQILSAMKA